MSERCERHCELEMRAQASNGSGHYAYRWSSELDDPDAPTIGGDVLRHAFAMGRRRTRLRAIDLETRQEVTRDLVFDLPRVVAVVHTASSSPALAFHLLDVEVVTGRPARLRAQRAALSLEQMCSGPPTWRAPWHVLVCVGPSSARARAKIGRFDETIECAGRCEPALEDLIGRAAASVRRGAVEAVPEPAPLGQARLVITGAPATVEIDGEAAGRVPLDVAIESHLDHVVRVEVEPCKRVDVHRVGARSLEVKRLRVGRCEAPRLLSIETRPAGARVLIGGHAVPSPTPLAGLPVRAGRLPLEVTLAGHETWTGTVDMDVHAKSVVVTLRPIESPPVVINRGNLQYLFVDEQLTGLIDRGERRTLTGLGRWPHEVCLYHRTTLVAAAARCRPVAVPSTQALVFEGEHAPVELDVSTEDAPRPSTLGIMGGLSMTFLTAGTRWVPSGTTVFSLGLRASHVSLLGFESALTAEFSYFDAASEALTSGGVIPTATIQRSLELGVLPTIPVFNRRLSVGAVVQVSSLLESINPQVAHQRTMHHWGLALGPSLRVRAFRFWDHGWIDVGYDFRFQLAPRELFQTFGRVHRAGVWITWDVL